jgi:hypothetical protein
MSHHTLISSHASNYNCLQKDNVRFHDNAENFEFLELFLVENSEEFLSKIVLRVPGTRYLQDIPMVGLSRI